MKNNSLTTWIRLASLAVVSFAPAMACSYTATAASAMVPANGGYAQISIQTQPGCVWQLNSLSPWAAPMTSSGSGTVLVQVSVAPNAGSQRTATIEGHGSAGQCDGPDVESQSGCGDKAIILFRAVVVQQ